MSGRCLVVANQTLGGHALDEALEDCLRRDLRRFHVLVPLTRLEHEASGYVGGFVISESVPPEAIRAAMDEAARRREADLEEARLRSEKRLELMIAKIERLGGEADGQVSVEEPHDAVAQVLELTEDLEEIIISTLPTRLSRWLRMDLPSRVARMTDVPVVTVEARD